MNSTCKILDRLINSLIITFSIDPITTLTSQYKSPTPSPKFIGSLTKNSRTPTCFIQFIAFDRWPFLISSTSSAADENKISNNRNRVKDRLTLDDEKKHSTLTVYLSELCRYVWVSVWKQKGTRSVYWCKRVHNEANVIKINWLNYLRYNRRLIVSMVWLFLLMLQFPIGSLVCMFVTLVR